MRGSVLEVLSLQLQNSKSWRGAYLENGVESSNHVWRTSKQRNLNLTRQNSVDIGLCYSPKGVLCYAVQRARGCSALCSTQGKEVNQRPVWGSGLSLLLCHTREHLCKPHSKSFQDSDILPTSQQLRTYHSGYPACLQLCSFLCKTAPVALNKHPCKHKQKRQAVG